MVSAHCNQQAISVSQCDDIDNALVACSFPAGVKGGDPEVSRFVKILESCRSLRRLGSCFEYVLRRIGSSRCLLGHEYRVGLRRRVL